MTKPRFIHIGYPKCASTTLQQGLFARHPEVYYLGCGYRPGDAWTYVDEDVALAVEYDLRFTKDLMFDLPATQAIFQRHFDIAEEAPSARAVGLSFEHLCYNWQADIDVTQKAARLAALFGDDARILMVVREQGALIRSYYGEAVRCGYPRPFDAFVEQSLVNIGQSFLSDLRYFDVYRLFCRHFGAERVTVVPFELLKADGDAFYAAICGASGLTSVLAEDVGYRNRGLSPEVLEAIRCLNARHPHNLGKGQLDVSLTFRYPSLFRKRLQEPVPPWSKRDLNTLVQLQQAAQSLVATQRIPPIDLTLHSILEARLRKLYGAQNARLADATGLDLMGMGYGLEPVAEPLLKVG